MDDYSNYSVSEPITISFIDREAVVSFILSAAYITAIISIFGLSTNILNIVVFCRSGLKDSITICFLGLAIADFVFLSSMCTLVSANQMSTKNILTAIPMADFTYQVSVYASAFYNTTSMLTAFTAVQKSCLVTFPLHFKNVFTKRRTVLILVGLAVINMSLHMPVFATQGFQVQNNSSRILPWYSDNRASVVKISTNINQDVIPIVLEIVVIFSLIILSQNLIASVKFKRNKSSMLTEKLKERESKELLLIKAVALIAGIFVANNMCTFVIVMVSYIEPEFGYLGKYELILGCMLYVDTILKCLNASCNFFIYLQTNKKYRQFFFI